MNGEEYIEMLKARRAEWEKATPRLMRGHWTQRPPLEWFVEKGDQVDLPDESPAPAKPTRSRVKPRLSVAELKVQREEVAARLDAIYRRNTSNGDPAVVNLPTGTRHRATDADLSQVAALQDRLAVLDRRLVVALERERGAS